MTSRLTALLMPLCALLVACGAVGPVTTTTGDAGPSADARRNMPTVAASWCRDNRNESAREMICPTAWDPGDSAYPEVACIDNGTLRTVEECAALRSSDPRRGFFARCDLGRLVQPCPQPLVGTCAARTVSRDFVVSMMDAAYLYDECW